MTVRGRAEPGFFLFSWITMVVSTVELLACIFVTGLRAEESLDKRALSVGLERAREGRRHRRIHVTLGWKREGATGSSFIGIRIPNVRVQHYFPYAELRRSRLFGVIS
jgi:hypothetical protein